VNIRGTKPILDHIKLVWASLWSDRALLYRQELDLDIAKSSMAVVVQELVSGDVSGVTFSINPTDATQGVVEAVYGLNQGLVDGEVEPDHWLLLRNDNTIREHREPSREKFMAPEGKAVILKDLSLKKMGQPPLSPDEVKMVYTKAKKLEELFGKPQDVEWTKVGRDIIILQSRPVTAGRDDDTTDKRGWYLSLHRSHENLKKLRVKIENEYFPAMIREAAKLAETDLRLLSDPELAAEIEKRRGIKDKWTGIYWDDFIPFAHGMRLFGRFYNDTVSPQDPFEFVELLSQAPLLSVNRNKALRKISIYLQQRPDLREVLTAGPEEYDDVVFNQLVDEFINQYGDPFCGTYGDKTCAESRKRLVGVITQMADYGRSEDNQQEDKAQNRKILEKAFFAKFMGKENLLLAEDLLELARASYRLRDDDNILLGRIEEQFVLALQEGRNRIKARDIATEDLLEANEIIRALADKGYRPEGRKGKDQAAEQKSRSIKARQLLGQPAGPGIGRGIARVIGSATDLGLLKKGEILVCDAIDPNMTLVVPLAAGIVERRGGMLIHGAIIAREYGIPCVTGVTDAATLIQTGEEVTVDGYLGIVTVRHSLTRT
jgi:pyruvate,water dikinase